MKEALKAVKSGAAREGPRGAAQRSAERVSSFKIRDIISSRIFCAENFFDGWRVQLTCAGRRTSTHQSV
jgi:hypothetical protein